VAVELRSFYAGEAHFVPDKDAAAAAHACSVHHNGVQADGGGDAVRPGEFGDGAHHWQRANRQRVLIRVPAVQQLFQLIGHKAVKTVRAVIGGDVQFVRHLFKFFLQDNQVLCARPDNRGDVISGFLKRFGDRVSHRGADAAANHDQMPVVLDFRGIAKRP